MLDRCGSDQLQAYTLGLLDATGLQHVCMEAATDLRRARARYAIDNVDWAKCVRQLNKDIKTANQVLSDELKVSIGRDSHLQVMLCQQCWHPSKPLEPLFNMPSCLPETPFPFQIEHAAVTIHCSIW